MKATLLVRTRLAYSATAFAKLVLWRLDKPLPGSSHRYTYRLAYVIDGLRVLCHDKESGKSDHRHFDAHEGACSFSNPDRLIADFERDIARWNDEIRGP